MIKSWYSWVLFLGCLGYVTLSGIGLYYESHKTQAVRLIILGPPGSGKGTVSERLSNYYGIPVITVSGVIRQLIQEGAMPEAKAVHEKMKRGDLVSDDMVWSVLKKALQSPRYARGYILDGFPRTLAQAKILGGHGWGFDQIIELHISDDYIVKRLKGRRVHLPSGRTYNIYQQPPRVPGRDDVTGERLVKRPDDQPSVVSKRLSLYHQHAKPMLAWLKGQYEHNHWIKSYLEVNAERPLSALWEDLHQQLAVKVSQSSRSEVFDT